MKLSEKEEKIFETQTNVTSATRILEKEKRR